MRKDKEVWTSSWFQREDQLNGSMNKPTMDADTMFNDDWEATCNIYNVLAEGEEWNETTLREIESTTLRAEKIAGAGAENEDSFSSSVWRGRLSLSIQTRDTVFVWGPSHRPKHHHQQSCCSGRNPEKNRHINNKRHDGEGVFLSRNKVHDPHFYFKLLSEQNDAPLVQVEFTYPYADCDNPVEQFDDEAVGPLSV
jgi:hypothetical protein